MVKILSTFKIQKYQVIRFEKQPDRDYQWIKLGNKIYKSVIVHDAENCVAIESNDDISQIEYIEFLENF